MNFLALTTIQRKVNVNQNSELYISGKIEEFSEKFKNLLHADYEKLNPFDVGDTIKINSRMSSVLLDDIGKDNIDYNIEDIDAKVVSADADNVSLTVGGHVYNIDVDNLSNLLDKQRYSHDNFLSLTATKALSEISFDSKEFMNFNLETNVETSIFHNSSLLYTDNYSTSYSGEDNQHANLDINKEHKDINSAFESVNNLIKDKEDLAVKVLG